CAAQHRVGAVRSRRCGRSAQDARTVDPRLPEERGGDAREAATRRALTRSGMASFAARVVAWQRAHGRRGLPWQASRDPYRIWLSEVMLQQTQVATVLPYYAHFVDAFPTVGALAAAPIARVLECWSGLGYY